MITVFSVMVFSFGMTSFQKENVSVYDNDLVTYDNNSFVEESGWTLEQINISSNNMVGNSSVIVTDPYGHDEVYVWGSNDHGQLGVGDETSSTNIPMKVDFGMDYSDIKFLSTQDNYAMAVLVDENGKDVLFTWGDNTEGALGLGDSTKELVYEPQEVTGLVYDEIKSIDIGYKSSLIVLTTGGIDTVWTTGDNSCSQLGIGSRNDDLYNYEQIDSQYIDGEIISVDFGKTPSVATIDNSGESHLYLWGSNTYNQVSPNSSSTTFGRPKEYTYLPMSVSGYTIKQVLSSGYTTMVLLVDKDDKDHLYSWGSNSYGKAGVGSSSDIMIYPVLVKFPDNYTKIKDINSSFKTSSAIIIDSNDKEHIYFWGSNEYDLLGEENASVGDEVQSPFRIEIPTDDDYTIKEVTLATSYSAMIVDYNGSNQLYMWGKASEGGIGSPNEITNITVWDQTPMITFDNGPPSVINDSDKGKMLSFTLDWDANTVTPTKLDIIDSNGDTLIGAKKFSLNNELNGVEQEMNIEFLIPEGVENARFKILDDTNKTLVISQSFNIDKSLLDTFDDNISANYNWFTTKKKLSFTLNYPSSISLDSVQVKEVGTDKLIDIIIEPEGVINGEEYKINISDLKNESELYVYISAEFTNGYTIESEDFHIPATKFPGWITSLIALIIIITIIILIIITSIIWRKKAAYNKHHKMHKMKRAYR